MFNSVSRASVCVCSRRCAFWSRDLHPNRELSTCVARRTIIRDT